MGGGRQRLDLCGRWQLAFDPAGEGIHDGWAAGRWPEARAEWVEVPALWNLTHPDAEDPAFYRREVAIPGEWAGKILRLQFGGACYRTEAWLNGQFLGSHEGAYTPFWIDATGAARPGAENELVIRVAGLSRTKAVDGTVLEQSPASKQSWLFTHGGLWGEVELEALPPLFCEALTVDPDLRGGQAFVEVLVRNSLAEVRRCACHLVVEGPDGDVTAEERVEVVVPPGSPRFSFVLPIDDARPWSPECPDLYRPRATLLDQDVEIDALATTFGMRDFTVRDGEFFLNGEPIFLRGVLLQPHYPVTHVVPPDREMMVREITLAKEAGFNLIRAHIRPAPPGYLDLTDRMGMLVYAESSLAWIRKSPRLLDHGQRELQEMIARDRNHPSVVIWGIHNENRVASGLSSDALVRWVRAFDSTRVVIDHSGGSMAIDQDFGWTDRSTAVANRETTRREIQDVHIYIGAPVPPAACAWLRTLGTDSPPVDIAALGYGLPAVVEEWQRAVRSYRGKILFSELGCGGLADLDRGVEGFGDRLHLVDARETAAYRDSLHEGFAARRLDRVFGDVAGLVHAAQEAQATGNRRQIEAVLCNPRVSGYMLTQLNDVSWEFHAGILDQWRNPKLAHAVLQRLHRPRCLILSAASRVATRGDAVDLDLTLVDRLPVAAGERAVVAVADPAGNELVERRFPVPVGARIKHLGRLNVPIGDDPGRYRITAHLASDVTVAADESILALPYVNWTEVIPRAHWLGAAPDAPLESDTHAALVAAARPSSLSHAEWTRLLDMVSGGATGIIGPLRPGDELARQVLANRGIRVEPQFGFGNWMGCHHWVPASPLFAGLPAGGLAGEPYVDVIPQYSLGELGGDLLAGALRHTEARKEPPRMVWLSDVEAIALGRGTLLFCQYRIFDRAARNPLAARLLGNLLTVAAGERS